MDVSERTDAIAALMFSQPSKRTDKIYTRSRKDYTRSLVSARSSRSRRSDLSASSSRSASSSCSATSRGSRLSHSSEVSRTFKDIPEPPLTKKFRRASKHLIRRHGQRQSGTPCEPVQPLSSQHRLPAREYKPSSATRMRVDATVAMRCSHCNLVFEAHVGTKQSSNICCRYCHEFFGLGTLSNIDTSMSFTLLCYNCGEWEKATIPGQDVECQKDYDFSCSYCRGLLFFTTVSVGKNTYDCTFCELTFLTKYLWERHETTKHAQQCVWECLPDSLLDAPSTPCDFCSFDGMPSSHLIGIHRFDQCGPTGYERSYRRKDQLVQHLRGFHRCSKVPQEVIEGWMRKTKQPDVTWVCGVCGSCFTEWTERSSHVGKHWDMGLNMLDWNSRYEVETSSIAPVSSAHISTTTLTLPRMYPGWEATQNLSRHESVSTASNQPGIPLVDTSLGPSSESQDLTAYNSFLAATEPQGPQSSNLGSGFWSRVRDTAHVFGK